MNYQEFVDQQFRPRSMGMLTSIRDQLVAAGVAASRPLNVTSFGETDTDNLRFQLVIARASGPNRVLTCWIELAPAGVIDGQMALLINLLLQGGNTVIDQTYDPGPARSYVEGIDFLITQLGVLETRVPDVVTRARQYLQV